ncbi:pyridine nucleotide-disulphide oxidoreductase dimerization region [Haloterrigena turkmenica DSM 5511]|uniref:Pyridine nucleotide-disulphide oxidoreductase dimerization region n=1 Tax=Haloterrigena turkmenica (strain ATCC 51198 / DSM 5511 / JCM 9101 / NCIMB 13204 / VKM B-1734 / 4k) TaxID=543526 RepID=D2RU88_HALTV|nr:dihydrolipoyl dehydrogenase [Haloterrigena turkmenica]ADB59157.1 pyridine nucleotide-disulphide oxidoreductase dimerization region [Haloterrigena turkmenica DSM 5511]
MDEYDLIAVGGGSGSQVATAAAERGLETAVIERGPLGGACITRGCVPSKALIHRADIADSVRHAEAFGVGAALEGVDYGEMTAAIHDTVYEKADRQEASLEDAENVTLYRGEGRFADERTLEVDLNDGGDVEVRGDSVVLGVGGRPMIPPIDGLEDVDFLTSDDALFLDEQPDSLVVVGGGYIGAELGYFFAALGTDVSLVGRSERLVPREDDAVSEVVTESLERYCDVYTGYEAAKVAENDTGVVVTAEPNEGGDGDDGESSTGDGVELEADDLLLATGRRPNTDTLNLEATGVETDDGEYVVVDDRLETTCDGVWALGDIVGEQPFKHAADYEAKTVSANLLEDGDQAVDYGAMPHAIFTEPQVASVGRTEGELEDADREYESATVPFDAAPLGMIMDADDGFVKVLAAPDGEILGCHIVGPQASTLIQEVVTAMEGGGTVDDVAEPVHVHPALSEVVYTAFDELSSSEFSTAPDWRDVSDE